MRFEDRTEAHRAFANAVEFHQAAIRNMAHAFDDNDDVEIWPLIAPAIVSLALAAEIYLKSLILHRNKKHNNEHRLHDLYTKLLDETDREAVLKQYQERRSKNPQQMLRELGAISKAFVTWRYAHEKPLAADIGALHAFTDSLYLAARELVPSWDVPTETHDRIINADRSIIFAGDAGVGDAELHRVAYNSFVGRHGGPKASVIESKEHGFSLAAPVLNLDSQAASLNVSIGGRANPKDSGTSKSSK
jgi:hypothetical protein